MAVSKPLLTVNLIDSVESYCVPQKENVNYNIEIKSAPGGDNVFHPEPGRYADLLIEVLEEKNITGSTIIQSFDMRPLQYCMHISRL